MFQYGFNFYLQYLINFGEYFQVCEHPSGEIMGYGEFHAVVDLFQVMWTVSTVN